MSGRHYLWFCNATMKDYFLRNGCSKCIASSFIHESEFPFFPFGEEFIFCVIYISILDDNAKQIYYIKFSNEYHNNNDNNGITCTAFKIGENASYDVGYEFEIHHSFLSRINIQWMKLIVVNNSVLSFGFRSLPLDIFSNVQAKH